MSNSKPYNKMPDIGITFVGNTRNIALYLREIRRYGSLTAKEEADLTPRIRAGDREALNRLICSNLRFVVSVCRNYRNLGLTLSDLINEGNLGLIRAAKRFDETRQFKFVSYAVWWIRQSILQALAEQGRLIKIPSNKLGMLQKIGRTKGHLEQILGREPTVEELSLELRIHITVIQENSRLNFQPISLDTPGSSDGETGLVDILMDEKAERADEKFSEREISEAIEAALSSLNQKEESVLRMYFGIGRGATSSLEDIGMKLGLTRERVRQIKEGALSKLRQATRSKTLFASTRSE